MSDLKTVRKDAGLTQEDLAGLIGTRQGTLAEIETGKRIPRKRTIKKVESILGEEVDWRKTAAGDEEHQHIMVHMVTLLNEQKDGVKERIAFTRQCLQIIELTLNE